MSEPNDYVVVPLRALARHEHSDHSVAAEAADRIESLWQLNDDYRCQLGSLERELEGQRETVDGLSALLAQRGRELERVKIALANAISERDAARAMLECARNG